MASSLHSNQQLQTATRQDGPSAPTVLMPEHSMLLGSIGSYLQNQPAGAGTGQNDVQASQAVPATGDTTSGPASNLDDYQPSTRAILISAIATDIDITRLEGDELGNLQHTLQQYGLLQQNDLAVFGRLRQAMQEGGTSALEAMDQLADSQQPYQQHQASKRLQALFHNLASARSPEAA